LDQSHNKRGITAIPARTGVGLFAGLYALPALTLPRVVMVTVLALCSMLTQAASIGLLMPAFQMMDDPGGEMPGGPLATALQWGMSIVNLPQSLGIIFSAVFFMVVISQSFLYLYDYFSARFVTEIIADLRRASFTSIMYARMPFHYGHRSGNLVSTIQQDGHRAEVAITAMREIMIRGIMASLYAVLLLLISWRMALVSFGVLIGISLIVQLWMKATINTGAEINSLNQQVNRIATERIQAVKEVKLAGSEKRESQKIGELLTSHAVATRKLIYRASQIRLVTEPLLIGTGLLVIQLGTNFAGLSLAEVGVFVYALLRTAPEVRALNQARYRVAGHTSSVRNLLAISDEARREAEESAGTTCSAFTKKRQFSSLSKEITLDQVAFAYNADTPILSGLNLTIAAGQTTAIVGPSGVGKSTILSLLVRLLTPTEGKILFDGTPIEQLSISSLRSGVSLVAQDSLLFDDTILENIRYAYPQTTLDQVENVAEICNIHQFIVQLPKGYATVVGERGVTLSTGQRQRISLARALLGDPSVLLLDEVTSAQDPDSEHALQEAVWQVSTGRTVIIVTHRLSSIQGVHRALVLQDGKFVEDGAPEELIKANGLFRHYYDLQIGAGWQQIQSETAPE
jgi:subfamily B ATP-binding cassette protein MsbA